jgi:hypothetical protein
VNGSDTIWEKDGTARTAKRNKTADLRIEGISFFRAAGFSPVGLYLVFFKVFMVRLGVSPSNQPRSSIKSSASQRADSRSMSKGFKNYQYSSSGKINIAI